MFATGDTRCACCNADVQKLQEVVPNLAIQQPGASDARGQGLLCLITVKSVFWVRAPAFARPSRTTHVYHNMIQCICVPKNVVSVHQLAVDDDWNTCRCMFRCRRRRAGICPSSIYNDTRVPKMIHVRAMEMLCRCQLAVGDDWNTSRRMSRCRRRCACTCPLSQQRYIPSNHPTYIYVP